MVERWLDVPGYELRYQASNRGRVRSLPRIVLYRDGRRKPLSGRVLRTGFAGRERNYAIVQLSKGNKTRIKYVHDLVLSAFVGPKPAGMESCHGKRGHKDNRLSNLYYGTPSRNQRDRRRDGTGNNKPVCRSDGVEYDSVGEAAVSVGIDRAILSAALNRHRSHAAGYRWEFINREDE